MSNDIEAPLSQEDRQWKIESDARTIKEYYELLADKDRYSKAIELVKKESNVILEALTQESDYKERIGFAKK